MPDQPFLDIKNLAIDPTQFIALLAGSFIVTNTFRLMEADLPGHVRMGIQICELKADKRRIAIRGVRI